MKAFDAFGSTSSSDCDTTNSSGSESSLLDSLEKEKMNDGEAENEVEKAPQCLGKREFESNTVEDKVDKVRFSFQPHTRCSSSSSSDSESSSSSSDSDSSRSNKRPMYLSRRMSYKVSSILKKAKYFHLFMFFFLTLKYSAIFFFKLSKNS
jgi:hypothetical protein